MEQALANTQQNQHEQSSLRIEKLDAPEITFLGSIDDEQGVTGFGLESGAPKPFLAIIYNGV